MINSGFNLWNERVEVVCEVCFVDIKGNIWLYIKECVVEFLNWLVLDIGFYGFGWEFSNLGYEIWLYGGE